MERRKFTREFKLEAVRLIKDRGVSYVQASQDLSVHPSQLRDWVKKFATFRQLLTMQRMRLGRRIDVATRGVPHTRHPADTRRCRPIQTAKNPRAGRVLLQGRLQPPWPRARQRTASARSRSPGTAPGSRRAAARSPRR
jgi:transposase-like protein